MKNPKIFVNGFEPSSMTDWPNKNCSVLFLKGCNLSCHYCFNKELNEEINIYNVFDKLESRKKVIKNIILSGGEASLHPYFSLILEFLVHRGFKIGIHTNGHNIKYILNNLEAISFLGVDLKSDPESYKKITGKDYPLYYEKDLIFKTALCSNVYTLISLAKKNNIEYELRSVISSRHTETNVSNMAKIAGFTGANKYYITSERIDKEGKLTPVYSNKEMENLQKICSKYIKTVIK